MTRPQNDDGFRHLGMGLGSGRGRAQFDPRRFMSFNNPGSKNDEATEL
jgi:hypothetical protein